MTTNNNNSFPGLPNDIDWNGALNAAEAGLPDPAIIARLANEFFTESPSLEEVKDSTVVQKQEPSEASITEVLNREVISNVKITGLPGIATQTQFPPVPPVSIPGIPAAYPQVIFLPYQHSLLLKKQDRFSLLPCLYPLCPVLIQ